MVTELLTPDFSGGVKNTHYFNGRLLTAEALQADQTANRQQHEQLGQAAGAGIVTGLRVTKRIENNFVVYIAPGLALNKKGQAMTVAEPGIELRLQPTTPASVSDAGLFVDCVTIHTEAETSQTGAYVLVMSPASGFEGQAPMHTLTDQGALNGCGRRYAVEGIVFNLVPLDMTKVTHISDKTVQQLDKLTKTNDDDPVRLSKLRNVLAHVCLGTEAKAAFPAKPFQLSGAHSAFNQYGGVDALGLTDCELPLALIHMTAQGIQFVDNWAVRRRVTAVNPSSSWPLQAGERQLAEAEATFLQFQEQVSQLFNPQPLFTPSVVVDNYFRFLPPAGLLPFNQTQFFQNIPFFGPRFLEGAHLSALLKEAHQYAPIDLNQKEMIWLYQVRENDQAIKGGENVQPVIVFVTAHIAPQWVKRLDVARWNYFYYR